MPRRARCEAPSSLRGCDPPDVLCAKDCMYALRDIQPGLREVQLLRCIYHFYRRKWKGVPRAEK